MSTFDPTSPFDLNLIRILLALDRTRNVTRAAELLNMSQSGFSSALARLRRHCEDQLFVRSAAGMVATANGRRYVEVAAKALATIEQGMLSPAQFDPVSMRSEFRMVMSDIAEIVFLPKLVERLKHTAPHASLRCHSLPKDGLAAMLSEGVAELALGYYPDLDSQAFYRQRLYKHTFACLVRRGHPLDAGRMTSRAYGQLGHVVVESPSRSAGLLERWLKRKKIERNIVLHTTHILSLPAIVEATDLVATVPLAVATWFARRSDVTVTALPVEPPVFDVHQYWHRRFHRDGRNEWLRQQVTTLFNANTDDWQSTEEQIYGKSLRRSATRDRRR